MKAAVVEAGGRPVAEQDRQVLLYPPLVFITGAVLLYSDKSISFPKCPVS